MTHNLLAPTRDEMIEDVVTVDTPDAHADHALDSETIRRGLAKLATKEITAIWIVMHGSKVVRA